MNTQIILEDVNRYIELLYGKYGIQMYPNNQNQNLNMYPFIGEFFTAMGTPLRLHITVYPGKTDVKVYTMNRQCVYQQSYKTTTNSRALSQSTGVFRFIERAYKTM